MPNNGMPLKSGLEVLAGDRKWHRW